MEGWKVIQGNFITPTTEASHADWLNQQRRYDALPTHLQEWAEKNQVKISKNTSSARFQIVCMFADEINKNVAVTKRMLQDYCARFGVPTTDPIQIINKTDQWGLRHMTLCKKYYTLPRPFEYIGIHVEKRKNFTSNTSDEDKEKEVLRIKRYITENYIDVPTNLWQMGHRDPNGSNDAGNLIMQPPLQGRYRDAFKFDDNGLRLCPTVAELKRNALKYYSPGELADLAAFLSATRRCPIST